MYKKIVGVLAVLSMVEIAGLRVQTCSVLVNKRAPDVMCELVSSDRVERMMLHSITSKFKVLFFYPGDFTFVCPTELLALQRRIEDFKSRDVQVFGVSVDSVASHQRWLKTSRIQGGIEGVSFPLISDSAKTISQLYGVLDSSGVALRAVVIIDADNIVQALMVNNLDFGRNIDEVLRIIDAINFSKDSGQMCPANWRAGDPGIKSKSTAAIARYLTAEE